MQLNKDKIHYYQKNRGDFLMIDYVTELEIGNFANGYKDLDENLWFFKIHWPGDPNMPASLQLESLTQLCALSILTMDEHVGKFMYLVSANNLKFKKKITPEFKRFNLETKIISFKRGIANCTGQGFVDNDLACSADFRLILADEIKKFKVNK